MRRPVVVFFLVLVSAVPARAEVLLLGGETASMGGAGVASGTDSAMFYLNPAGLSRVPTMLASFSGSLYGISRLSAPRFFNETREATLPVGNVVLGDTRLSSSRFSGYSTVLGVMFGFGPPAGESRHVTAGLSLCMPESTSLFYTGEATAADSTAKSTFAYSYSHQATHVGPSFAVQLGRRVHLGASLYVAYQPVENSLKISWVYSDVDGHAYVSATSEASSTGYSLDFSPVLGTQVQLTPELFIGLAFSPPSAHLGGSSSGSASVKSYGSLAAGTSVRETTLSGDAAIHLPLRVTLGASYRRAERWGLAADATLLVPRRQGRVHETAETTTTLRPGYRPETSTTRVATAEESAASMRVNAGGELYLRPNWILRAGFFLVQPTVAALDDQLTLAQLLSRRLTTYGGTLGLGNVQGALETTYGVAFGYSQGTTVGQVFGSEGVRETPMSGYQLMIFISGTISLRDRHPASSSGEGTP